MTPRLRKFALTAHITSSVGWLGAIAAFLALAVAGLTSKDEQTVRAAYLAMELTAWFVIVPLALASLLSGFIQALGTPWGLSRHYWVLVKLVLTVFATIVLLVKMKLIGEAARMAAETPLPLADLRAAGNELVVHAAGGLLVLLVLAALSVYKPQGMTAYGQRKQQAQRPASQRPCPYAVSDSDAGAWSSRNWTISAPRSAYLIGLVAIVVLHFVILHLVGGGLSAH